MNAMGNNVATRIRYFFDPSQREISSISAQVERDRIEKHEICVENINFGEFSFVDERHKSQVHLKKVMICSTK